MDINDLPPAANLIVDTCDQLTEVRHRLEYANELRCAAAVWTAQYVNAARAQGWSWQVIGDCLGVTRQAAQQQYGG